MSSKQIQTWVFAGLLVVLFLAVCRIFAPFLTVLLWSVLLYVLSGPLFNRTVKHLNGTKGLDIIWRNLLAAAFSIVSVVVIVIPLGFVVMQLGRQLTTLIRNIIDYLNANPHFFQTDFQGFAAAIKEWTDGAVDLAAIDIKQQLISVLSKGMNTVVFFSTQILRNIGVFFIGLAFMVFTLFFFFLDGPYLLTIVVRALPIRTEYINQLVVKFRDITRNLFLGYILVAFVQGVIAYIIFSVFGVQGALVFSILLMFCSFIPMIGSATVWFPLGLIKVFTGNVGGGLAFLALSAVFISLTDNFLRPFFLRDRIKLHPLIIFFAILGGISAFGFNGLIVGPMIVIFFLTVLDMFLLEHDIQSGH